MTSTTTDSTRRNISILNNRGGTMADEERRPEVPPDPQETTLKTSLTDKLLVNEDSHEAATQSRFLGCVPPPAEGGGANFTE